MDELLAWIYPNRVLVAASGAVIVAIVALTGYRRGWHHVARRHPIVTTSVIVAALAFALPLAWYLGSPLFIRSELVEPPPVAGADPPAASATAPLASKPLSTPQPTPSATPTPLALAGSFVGADDFHFAKGTARLIESSPGAFVVRLEEFSVRNGPDLYVYLSPDPDGYVDGAIELGTLKATDGSFNYEVPAGTDVSDVRSVVIWCKSFSVQFGAAALAPTA
jgi:hypothetical protein